MSTPSSHELPPEVAELRPLSIPELLDRTFSLHRRHWMLFIGIMGVPSAVSLLFSIPSKFMAAFQPTHATAGQSPALPSAGTMAMWAAGGCGFVLLIVAWQVTYILATAATTVAVSDIYRQSVATVASSYGQVKRLIWRLLVLSLLTSVRAGGAFLLLLLVAFGMSAALSYAIGPLSVIFLVLGVLAASAVFVVLSLRYSLSVPSLVLESLIPSKAIKRSISLTRDHLGRAFLILFCGFVVTYACFAMFQGPFAIGAVLAGPETRAAFWLQIAGAVAGAFGAAVSSPIMILGLTVLYYDARVRHEALDLQVMLRSLDADGAGPAPLETTPPPAS